MYQRVCVVLRIEDGFFLDLVLVVKKAEFGPFSGNALDDDPVPILFHVDQPKICS